MSVVSNDPATASTHVDVVPKGIKLSWGSGALGVAILLNAIAFTAMFFMVQVLGLDPGIAGTVVFLSKIMDIISDPLVGKWSDQYKTSGSRRRPFMLYGTFISAFSFTMIFTAPEFSTQWITAAYMFLALTIYTIGYTLFNVTYLSMPAEMTDDYHERTSIHGYRMAFVGVGGLLGQAGIPFVQGIFGANEPKTYVFIGLVGSVIILISMLTAYFGTAKARFSKAAVEKMEFINEYKIVLRNRHFLRVLGIKAAQLFGVAGISVTTLFFFEKILQVNLQVLATVGFIVFVFTLASIPVFVRISKVIGKAKTYAIAGLIYVVSALSWVLSVPGEPEWAIYLRYALTGISVSGNVVMAMSMLTDCIEYDARKTGVRREGVYTALYSFVEKFTFALAPLIIGFALSLAGYTRELSLDQITPAIRQAILLGMSYIPAAMGVVAIVLLLGYKLTEEELHNVGAEHEE